MNEIAQAIKRANYVYIIGNGGSASTANHLANDLVKMCGVKAISLCANEAVIMAYANDCGYEYIFINQLKVFFKQGDLLITISGSGMSPNILAAIAYINSISTGCVYSFPTMHKLGVDMMKCEDQHIKLAHSIARELMI
jgi:D-sedoheptulose 7-phosphate isomerase